MIRFQFTLRSLFVVVTITAVALGVHSWWVSRLEYLVDRYNLLLDLGRYEEAECVAQKAAVLHPDSPIADHMVCESGWIREHANRLYVGEPEEQPANGALDLTWPAAGAEY